VSSDSDIMRMANDIANFWKYYPLSDARENFAEHINKYWNPKMRRRLHELALEEAATFQDLVVKSIDLVKCEHHNPIKAELRDKVGGG
jgi:formate dehydrogenase subunit delta